MGITLFGKPGEAQPAPEIYIRNTLSNRQLYKKAYLIEFLGADGKSEDVFTFSTPPESEELTYTQRKTETKTFGGLHVDDYGIDAVKIVLSGSTINQSLKEIYRGDKDSKWLSGEEEIYYLRDLIMKYKSLDSLVGGKREIIIYDLSKTAYIKNIGGGFSSPVKNYWRAFPGDFKIRRASDKPFTYKYSFEFTGIARDKGGVFISHGKPPDLNKGELGLIQHIMNGLTAALDFIDGINAWVNDVLDKVNQVSALLKVLGNVMSYAANTLSGIVDSAGDAAVGFVDGTTRIVDGANSIVSLPRTIQLKALNVGLEVQNATNALMKSVDSLTKNCRDMFTSEYWEIPRETLDQYAMSSEEFKDSLNARFNQAENAANEMTAAAKSSGIPDTTVGNSDSATGGQGNSDTRTGEEGNSGQEPGRQRIVLSYGHVIVMLNSTDTLESLAQKYFGDPDRAIDIATYNGVASLSDLRPGDIIRIPILTRTRKMANNLIFARREDRDNYGRDILLTDDGHIVPSNSGDYALTNGAANLSQAVLLRLRESVAKRIRVNAYGIRTNISDPTAGVAYIISSIELTVSDDPRVASVDDIHFQSRGDYLNVNVLYSDINNAGGSITGRV
jgi:hypothetical protein